MTSRSASHSSTKIKWVLALPVIAVSGFISVQYKKFEMNKYNPSMVNIPSGRFDMGCPKEHSRSYCDYVGFIPSVNIKAFKIMTTEVTFAMWDACFVEGGCAYKPKDEGWGRGKHPVINVNWNEITREFIPWLSKKTGKNYRLPSEAEWEYAARAGSGKKYSWGNDEVVCSQANYGHSFVGEYECGKKESTAIVGSFNPNAYGLYDIHGNVAEFTQDCWHGNEYFGTFHEAPTNGDPWESENNGDCEKRILRGGSWATSGYHLSLWRREHSYPAPEDRYKAYGFRLALNID